MVNVSRSTSIVVTVLLSQVRSHAAQHPDDNDDNHNNDNDDGDKRDDARGADMVHYGASTGRGGAKCQ